MGISGIYEIGLTRVQTVDALIEFSRRKGKCLDFLDYIRRISLSPPARDDVQPLTIMTIYRAKGLEWQSVFVPGCNEGLMPCATAESSGQSKELVQDVEAERRLFYVAVTRAKSSLHLYTALDKPLSRFLADADIRLLLEEMDDFSELLENSLRIVRQKGLIRFCRYIGKFHMERFLKIWQPLSTAHKEVVNSSISSLQGKIDKAIAAEKAKKPKPRSKKQSAVANNAEEILAKKKEAHQNAPLQIRKFKSTYFALERGDILEFEPYEDGDIIVLSPDGLVGVIEFEQMPEFDKTFVLWSECEGRVDAVSEDGLQIEAYFSEFAFIRPRNPKKSVPATSNETSGKKKIPLADKTLLSGVEILKRLVTGK